MKSVTVSKNDAGQRLDKFLSKSFNMPASLMYKYLRKKRIKLNGKRCDGHDMLSEGDLLELYINDEFFEREEKQIIENADINVVYEDNNIIIMDKPQGILSHGEGDSMVNRMIAYLVNKGEYNQKTELSFTPALCNRLDRNTSGLMIGAKNADALRTVNDLIKNRKIKKYYLCLCLGIPEKKQAILESFLDKDENINKVSIHQAPTKDSRAIRTGYRVLKEGRGMSLCEIELFTGRPHQIRAQMAMIGCPIAGDMKYGNRAKNKELPFSYQALYSYKLVFGSEMPENLAYLSGKVFEAKSVYFKDFI